ncbi:hypothetical protein HPB47_003334 [Ixodes persulcatus]|uniref:Uncharacterized protein n=1 Tax=Ixodes persulcatus TaxID=34615 RepID=A0AC60PKE1_IXOPE|nr:hypothetical protein HPB47_003334 [Ixodes persulcatus]
MDVITVFGSIFMFQITFGDIAVPEAQLKHVDTKQKSIYAQELVVMVFGTEALPSCCLTGSSMKGKLPKEGVKGLIEMNVCTSREEAAAAADRSKLPPPAQTPAACAASRPLFRQVPLGQDASPPETQRAPPSEIRHVRRRTDLSRERIQKKARDELECFSL